MIAAAPLVQDPRPTLVGERVNSQGSRKAKELLLADDYDGLVQVAEDQVEGGAHVLDICVALTERQDEDEQMRQVVKRVSLAQPSPIQIDSTEPDVLRMALEQIPGRAIVNSVNLEAGRDKLDTVVPLAIQHGAAVIALTIDEVGMAKTAAAQGRDRPAHQGAGLRRARPRPRAADLRPAHLHADHRRRGVAPVGGRDDRGHPPRSSRRCRRSRPRWASPTSPSASPPRRARCSTRSSCTTAWRRGSTSRWSTPTTSRRTARSPRPSARWPTTWSSTAARTRSSSSSPTSRPRARRRPPRSPTRRPTWSPRRRCTGTSCGASSDGVEGWIDRSVEKIGAVPTLNEVLLPAMKEVGDKFGAGELILPFVLQSAEVMKRAVARLERYLDKLEGYTKGTVVVATVFGDVHDIGKSLVNTILTNNGYTVIDLGKQVPIGTIIEAAKEHDATAIGLSALLVSTSKQMPLCIQELHNEGLEFPVLLGGAAINRDFGLRVLYPGGRDSDEVYEPGVFYCKDAFEGLAKMDQIVDDEARAALVAKTREAAQRLRDKGPEPEQGDTTDASVRSAASTDAPVPEPPVLGRARDRRAARRGLPPPRHPRALQAALGRARREGRRVAQARRRGLPPAPGAHVARGELPAPAGQARLLPLLQRGQRGRRARPRGPRDGARAPRLPAPAQARPHLPGRLLPSEGQRRARRRRAAGGHRRRRGHRADGAPGGRRRVRRAALRPRPRRPDGRGHRRVAARLRAPRPRDRRSTRAGATRGATPPAPSSPSTRRSSACSTRRRSACA